MTFTQLHADRLLRLADVVQEAGRQHKYDQSLFPGEPNACGCAAYHSLLATPQKESGHTARTYYELTSDEYWELFGDGGCGNARRSGIKAAQYIREFVKRKLKGTS
jgi:hypothetical protein